MTKFDTNKSYIDLDKKLIPQIGNIWLDGNSLSIGNMNVD